MKKSTKIVIGVAIVLVVCLFIILAVNIFNKDDQVADNSNFVNNYTNIDKENEISYQNSATVEELKEETGLTGDESIYQIDTEYDGRKTLNVKADIQYKVALAGILTGEMPEYNNIDQIISQTPIEKNGMWIDKNIQDKFLNMLGEVTKSEYEINSNGYLSIKNGNNQNDNDKKIESLINGQNKYIITITDKYYQLDTVTGEVVEFPFEQLDNYQTFDIVRNTDNSNIICITSNKNNRLTNKEIMQDVIDNI